MLIDKSTFLRDLNVYTTSFPEEQKYLQDIIGFVSGTSEPFSRSTLEGHITASAWVLSPDKLSVVLIHHAKLDMWFQPGGHIEATDATVLQASIREVAEETGVSNMESYQEGLFDIDIHTIPERKGVPEHLHYDVRYCFVAKDISLVADYEEVKGVEWVTLKSILDSPESESSLLRMARKTTI